MPEKILDPEPVEVNEEPICRVCDGEGLVEFYYRGDIREGSCPECHPYDADVDAEDPDRER